MNRLGIVIAVALASVTSFACTASSGDGQDEQNGQQQAVSSDQDGPTGKVNAELACHRTPPDTCVTVGSYCERHGGHLWCTLDGACTCRYDALQLGGAQVVQSAASQSKVD